MQLILETVSDPTGTPLIDPRLSLKDVRESLFRMLQGNTLCSIATISADHQAYAHTAYFAYSNDLDIYFLSHPNAQHCRNIEINPSMAMTIFSTDQSWGGSDQGLQLFGDCKPAGGETAGQAAQVYQNRFPAFAGWQMGMGQDDPGKDYRFYQFRVDRIKVYDEQSWGRSLFAVVIIHR